MSADTFSWRCPSCGTLVEQLVDGAAIDAVTPCCSTTTMSSSRGDELAEVLAFVERKLDDAARSLNPVMCRTLDDGRPIELAVHDALNSLAAIRLRVGLAAEQLVDQVPS